ncbi:MAG: hypothetical protein IT163_10865 [Bryobacterales bacterium]|nr:hypothetical protein [Bryobacterales bacterium]
MGRKSDDPGHSDYGGWGRRLRYLRFASHKETGGSEPGRTSAERLDRIGRRFLYYLWY